MSQICAQACPLLPSFLTPSTTDEWRFKTNSNYSIQTWVHSLTKCSFLPIQGILSQEYTLVKSFWGEKP